MAVDLQEASAVDVDSGDRHETIAAREIRSKTEGEPKETLAPEGVEVPRQEAHRPGAIGAEVGA